MHVGDLDRLEARAREAFHLRPHLRQHQPQEEATDVNKQYAPLSIREGSWNVKLVWRIGQALCSHALAIGRDQQARRAR